MTGPAWLAAAGAAAAAALLLPPAPRLELLLRPSVRAPRDDADWLRRWRTVWTLLSGVAAATFVGGPAGLVAAPVAAVATWLLIDRSEPAGARREREEARRDLPHLVGLLADALRSGRSPDDALAVVADALPGPAAARLSGLVPRLRLGVDPAQVWSDLGADTALAPLGRALARAHRSGAPVAAAVERLADELARSARAEVEDRARAVGVKAAVPLGLCLLPAFILIGIVPVVAGLLTSLGI